MLPREPRVCLRIERYHAGVGTDAADHGSSCATQYPGSIRIPISIQIVKIGHSHGANCTTNDLDLPHLSTILAAMRLASAIRPAGETLQAIACFPLSAAGLPLVAGR